MTSSEPDAVFLAVSLALDAAMQAAGIGQERTARRAKVATNTVLRVLKGRDTRLSTLQALAKATGCDIEIRFIRRPK
jgi:transcriptional regulator with XRE-family HTH domain